MMDTKLETLDNTPIWVAAHLYDDYGRFLISLTTKEKADQYRYYQHARYESMEKAEEYVRLKLDLIDKQSKISYNMGHNLSKPTRQGDSPFLRHVLREALKEMGYNGWVQVA